MSMALAAKPRIMIVDGSFIMRKLVREIVESDDELMVADVAEDGRVALQKVREVKPDLILLDIEMPKMSGLEALRRLGLRSTSKVVILSALGGEGTPESKEALRLGAAAVLQKPSGSVSLDVKVREGARILRAVRAVLGMPPRCEPPTAPETPTATDGGGVVQAALLQAMTAGVLVFDAALTLSLANDAACRLLGRAALPAGTTLDSVFDGYDEGLGDDIRAVRAAGETLALADADCARPDGTWQSLHLTARRLAAPSMGVMVLLEDITREKDVKRLLTNTLSANVASKLLQDGQLSLGGGLAPASILFADIRSFTRLSQALGADGIVSMLNEYFSYMEDVLKDEGGVIDKYIGDAIMALFGVPLPLDNNADRAVRGGQQMLAALDVLNGDRQGRGQDPIHIGIGIASGEVIAGNIGSPSRMNYTVIGDAVNLASRVESLTKRYGAELLVCDRTIRSMGKPAPSRKLDVVRVSGQSSTTVIHEILRPGRTLDAAGIEADETGLSDYLAGRFTTALAAFRSAVASNPHDAAAAMLANRCEQLRRETPRDWDGVWTHTEK